MKRSCTVVTSLERANGQVWNIAQLPEYFERQPEVLCSQALDDLAKMKKSGEFSDTVLSDFHLGTTRVIDLLNNGTTLTDMRRNFAIWGRKSAYSVQLMAAEERLNGQPISYLQMRHRPTDLTLEACLQLTRLGLRGIYIFERNAERDGPAYKFYDTFGTKLVRRSLCAVSYFGPAFGTGT